MSQPEVGAGPDAPPLVDAAWVEASLGRPDVVVVEVGADATCYFAGHVPGAVPLDWLDDLHEPDRRGVVGQERLERLLGARGITRDDHVVLYGDDHNLFAANTYWVLRYYQHPRVSLLDGGRAAWLAEGRPLDHALPDRPPATYRSPGPDPSLRLTREELLRRFVGAPAGRALVDARPRTEYLGRAGERAADLPLLGYRLQGHVPGASNVPAARLRTSGGRLQPLPELRRLVGPVLATGADVALYCSLGGESALLWFVIHELLGHRPARLYDGGWAEYGALVGAPVER